MNDVLGAKWILSNTKSGIIFFANPDVLFDRRCVECICNEFQDASYSVFAPVMLKPGGAVDEENYWDEPDYWDELGKCFYLYRRATVKKRFKNINYEKKIMDVFAVTGSFFAIRVSDFIHINGFDEGTFLFCEENILGFRLKRAGKKTGLITYISYVHNHSQIIDNNLSIVRKYTIQMKSHYYFVKNYLSSNRMKLAILKAAQVFSIEELKWILMITGRR
ncbi:hypothetical protein D3Z50_20075 [Clostridiaceae bacterium]|nr:hypothetical protein [Clostridiaceae bacterium]